MGIARRTARSPHEFPIARPRGRSSTSTAAATSQTPRAGHRRDDDYYAHHRANVHRGVYPLAVEATELFEAGRERVAAWLGWQTRETVFTRNATEAINLVAYAWGRRERRRRRPRSSSPRWSTTRTSCPGSCCARRSAPSCATSSVDDEGDARPRRARRAPARRPRQARRRRARVERRSARSTRSPSIVAPRPRGRRGRRCSTARRPCRRSPSTSARSAPTSTPGPATRPTARPGIGVLHGRRELLEAMPPFLGGGHMIALGRRRRARAGPSCPAKFEAGTSPIAEAVGLGAAVDFLAGARHGQRPRARARARRLRARAARRRAGPDDPRPARRRPPRRAHLVRARRRRTRTTSPRSSAARASASAPATTARSR